VSTAETLGKLAAAVVAFDDTLATKLAQEAVEQGVDPLEIVEAGLSVGMKTVGDRFATGDMFLPELMLAAQAFQAAIRVVDPVIQAQGRVRQKVGKILIGTVEGDIHDLGKNIVGILAGVSGFQVVDVGFNVKAATFVGKVQELKPDILGLSSMLTSTRSRMRDVIEALKRAGLRDQVKVIVGGAVVSEQFVQEIGADAYGANAEDGVKKMRAFLEGSSRLGGAT
jgi:corrinoid protein of di/trimethylamine methyltransferase